MLVSTVEPFTRPMADEGVTAPVQPQVFRRLITTPPAPPWSQARAAQLEARHGAPLPIAELMFRTKRLEGWSPSKQGRFVALYIRAREYQAPFETTVDIDGVSVSVSFGSSRRHAQQARTVGIAMALALVTVAICAVAIIQATNVRMQVTSGLDALDVASSAKLRKLQALEQQQLEEVDLQQTVGDAANLEQFGADLAWIASAKRSDARIVGFHWDHGVTAIEARGQTSPFVLTERPVQRSAQPLSPGVWLWGLSSSSNGSR
jgi:hypothetical protein